MRSQQYYFNVSAVKFFISSFSIDYVGVGHVDSGLGLETAVVPHQWRNETWKDSGYKMSC